MAKKKTTKTIKKKKLQVEAKEIFYKRFLSYYLGMLDGSCFHNATRSYLMAKGYTPEQIKDISTPEIIDIAVETEYVDLEGNKEKVIKKKKVYHPSYETAKTEGNLLLTNPHIVKMKDKMLSDMVKDIEGIKKRHLELATQNKNLVVSRQANADMLKIHGALEDKTSIDIPQIAELTNKISDILKPKKK